MTAEMIALPASRLRSVTEEELVSEFLKRALVAARAQYTTAAKFDVYDRCCRSVSVVGGVGIGMLGMYALGGGAQFHSQLFGALATIVGAVVALVSVMQSTYRWRERAGEHRCAAGQYSDAMRKLELIVSHKPLDRVALEAWSSCYSAIGKTAPLVPDGIWRAVKRENNVR
jgi:hypothetical protein